MGMSDDKVLLKTNLYFFNSRMTRAKLMICNNEVTSENLSNLRIGRLRMSDNGGWTNDNGQRKTDFKLAAKIPNVKLHNIELTTRSRFYTLAYPVLIVILVSLKINLNTVLHL